MVSSVVAFILGGLCFVIIKCQWKFKEIGKEKHISKKTAAAMKSSNCPVYEDVTPNLMSSHPINTEANIAYGPITY